MPTQEQAEKAWKHGNKGKKYYDALTEEQKKAMWQYGYDRKLVDVNKLGPGAKAEYQRYVDPNKPEYRPAASDVQQKFPEYYKPQSEKLYEATIPKIIQNSGMIGKSPKEIMSTPTVQQPSAPQVTQATPTVDRRLLNAQRLEELTPTAKPQIAQPQLPRQTNARGKAVVQQGKVPMEGLIRPDNPFAPAVVNAVNTASLGLLERNTDAIQGLREKAPITSTVGSMAGYLLPFGAAKGALVKGTQTLGKRVLTDAALGIGVDTATEAIRGKETAAQAAGNVGQNAIFGIAADLALSALGSVGKAISKKLVNKQTLSTAEKAIVDSLPDQAKKEIILYVDPYGNVRKTPGMDLQLEAPKTDVSQIAPSKNIEAPFRLTPAEQARITPKTAEPKLTQSDLFKQPTTAQTPSSGINTLPTAKTAIETPIAKPSGIPSAEKSLSFPQTMKASDNTAPELKKLIEDNPLSYKPINNADTLKYAQELVDKNFDAAKALVKQGDNFNNATEAAMAQDVIRRMQNEAATNPAKWDEVFEVMEATSKKYKTAGQTVQTASMWSRMTPDGMLAYTKRVFDQANEVLPQASKVKLSPEIAQRITDTMTQIQSAPEAVLDVIRKQYGKDLPKWADNMLMSKSNEQLKDIAIAQVLADIGDKIPVSVARKISSVQAMGQLLNVKTFLRNILGNTSFSVVENISNTLAVPVDKALSKVTGKRSLALPQLKGSFKAGIDRAKESALDIKLGIDRTGVMEGKYNVPAGKTFKKGIGSTLEKTLKGTLNIPDEFAKGQIYDNVLKQQMKAANVTEATKEMTEYANYRALYGTFQDESFPARMMQAGKDFLNRVGVGKTVRGSSGQMTKEFGAGDLIIKYTRVPGNIISRAVEYTPAGLLKILSVGKNAKIANKQAEMAMIIGRAATGTTMIGLGAYLKKLGILQSEDKDRSKKALSLDRAEGLGNYKVNLTAIDRLLSNQDPTPQKGDELYSYNYLEPVSKAFALGAMIADEVGKGTGVFQKSYDIGGKALDEILDLPTLTVLRKMNYADDMFDMALVPVTESVGGFVPSLMRQTAQTLDPTARETKGESPIDTTINKVKANIPGLRQTLEPRVSPFGQEIKYPGGAVQNLINPSLKSVYTPSETTKKLKQLEDLTGENIQYPMDKAPAYVTEKKQKITLTPKEKTEYQKYAGQETEKIYKQLLLNKNLGNLSDAQLQALVKSLQKANQDAREKAKMALIKKRK